MTKHNRNCDGWFINDYNVIYVQGVYKGKFTRKSTKLKNDPKNLAYVKRNSQQILDEICSPKPIPQSFKEFGLMVLEAGAKAIDKDGNEYGAGRNAGVQRDAIARFYTHILPFFLKYRIDEVKPMDIERWQRGLLSKLSSSSTKACRHLVSTIFKKACANDMIPKNPCDYADKFAMSHKMREPYTIDEAKLLMSSSTGWLKVYLNLAFTTGMRIGEILGLKYSDIDEDMSCIYLQRSITKGRISQTNKQKNHARIIYILPSVMDLLTELRNEAKSDWIFTPRGKVKPWQDSKAIVERHFKPLLAKLEVTYKTMYATRHTFFSIATNYNIDPSFTQKLGGHSVGSKVTEKHYITREMTSTNRDFAQAQLMPFNDIFYAPKSIKKAK